MLDVNQITKGILKNVLNKEEDLLNSRMKICNDCKLKIRDKFFGDVEMCDSEHYLNTKTNQLSVFNKHGFRNGCGCILKFKLRVKEAKCPLDKW